MTAPPIHWQLDIIAHTDRMIAAAMHQLGDANEARWFVHRIMHRAMTDMRTPANRRDLDSALGAALRTANAA
ncbi:MAG: hypothetical protein NT015_10435 [Alphaproteobacteria bacterium]|nr:hypothetical protein [Alphaproteobacteria bacterium]